MFGTLRFVLAMLVLQAHLWSAGLAPPAWYAVITFYALSGFLMTLVLNEVYGFSLSGLVRFSFNRVLRLGPVYFVIIGLTVATIMLLGSMTGIASGLMKLPSTPESWIENIAIFGLTGFDYRSIALEMLAPNAWSLSIELVFYVVLAVVAARSARNLWVMMAIGVAVAIANVATVNDCDWTAASSHCFQSRYTVIQAGLIPFAVGGLVYFYREALLRRFSNTQTLVAYLALMGASFAVASVSALFAHIIGLYLAAVLAPLAIVPLYAMSRREIFGVFARWDRHLGNMAYPLFLAHWLVAGFVMLTIPQLPLRGFAFLLVAGGGSILLSFVLYRLVDRPIQSLRLVLRRSERVPTASDQAVSR